MFVAAEGGDESDDLGDEIEPRKPAGPKGYTHYVVRTAFHNGGIVSRHRSAEAAERAAAKYAFTGCTCGCASVVAAADYDTLPAAGTNPYAITR